MEIQKNFDRLYGKQTIYTLKKYSFAPKLSLFWNFSTIKPNSSEHFLIIDFSNSDKIFDEDDLINFFDIFSTNNVFENICLIIQPSFISSKLSKSFHKLFDLSTHLKSLELDFSSKNIIRSHIQLQNLFGTLRRLKSLQIFKCSLENIFINEEVLTRIGREIEDLSLLEISLNLKQTNVTPNSLINLSFFLSKISTLLKMTLNVRNTDLKLTKDDLTTIFKQFKGLKQLIQLHLDFRRTNIQLIDIIYIIRKCLKPITFPKLQHFHLSANNLNSFDFDQGKFLYYLQRKVTSFAKETSHTEMKSLVLKMKRNQFINESFMIFFSFFKKMSNLCNLTLRLKENNISFKIYLQFLFKINIENLSLDYCQSETEIMTPNFLQKHNYLDKLKKLTLKFSFCSNGPIEEMLQIFKGFPNLEKCHFS